MGYALRDNVTFCVAGEKIVFLDLSAGRYLGLSQSDETSLKSLVRSGSATSEEQDLSPGLLRLLVPSTGHGVEPFKLTVMPTRSLLDEDCAPAPISRKIAAIYWLCMTKRALQYRPLQAHIEDIRKCKAQCGSRPFEFTMAQALEDIRTMATRHDQCLLRSLALMRWAASRGMALDLVFGVTARPFQAHCWVQHGDMVLNDSLDHVINFTPILAA